MRGNILILSEDAVFARMLELELEAMQFSVATNSASASRRYDLILVDLDSAKLPKRVEEDARIVGFTRKFVVSALDAERRCSMILHRPFQMRVLREEVASINVAPQGKDLYQNGKESLDIILEGNMLTLGEEAFALRPKEAAVMSALLAKRGEPVSREELSLLIGESSTNKTDVHICYLRRKFAAVTERQIIKTVRGQGYKID